MAREHASRECRTRGRRAFLAGRLNGDAGHGFPASRLFLRGCCCTPGVARDAISARVNSLSRQHPFEQNAALAARFTGRLSLIQIGAAEAEIPAPAPATSH